MGILGPSGAGKSTLLRCINALVMPESGDVRVMGRSTSQLNNSGLRDLRRSIGTIFQEFALLERHTVLQNVLLGRLGYQSPLRGALGLFAPEDFAAAHHAVQQVELAEFEDRQVRRLSGGQKQRVGVARALAQQPEIILGDEPVANLDIRTADGILSLLVALTLARKTTLVLTLHDILAARRHCTRIVGMRSGRVVWDGAAEEFNEAAMERVFYASDGG